MVVVNRISPLRSERGQAAVETAFVMPLMVFMVLGIIQLGLIAQARAMAKYAAYRAVRVGIMHNADVEKMESAALFHLLPVLALQSSAGANAGEVILPTRDASEIATKFQRATTQNLMSGGLKQVAVVICGPLKGELDGTGSDPLTSSTHRDRHGYGSDDEVDFDDPAISTDLGGSVSYDDVALFRSLRNHLRTKLRIQVQFNYRMPIPFANWVIAHAYLGLQLPFVLRMGREEPPPAPVTKFAQQRAAAESGVYVVPINVNYALRMQSNFFLSRNPPPSTNECVHYPTE